MRIITIIALSILTLFLIAGCAQKPIGGERDEHGCLLTAGYTWCEAKQKCLRTWEDPCETEVESRAKEFCDDENVGAVYTCDDYIQVVSMVPGAGSTYYKSDGTTVQCPVIAPSSMSEECRQLFFETECEEVCTADEPLIGGDKDEHGCLVAAGYTWCETKQKCLRTWEEDCPPEGTREAEIRPRDMAFEYVKNTREYEKGSNLKIIKVMQMRCPGCWHVELEFDTESGKVYVEVTIISWEVTNAVFSEADTLSVEECKDVGGRPVNIVGGFTCDDDETNIGEVKGFISPHICCVKENTEKLCVDLCGDGICQVIVCLGTGCPCAETPESCPEDCG